MFIPIANQSIRNETNKSRRIDPKITEKHVIPMLVGHFFGARMANWIIYNCDNVHDIWLYYVDL